MSRIAAPKRAAQHTAAFRAQKAKRCALISRQLQGGSSRSGWSGLDQPTLPRLVGQVDQPIGTSARRLQRRPLRCLHGRLRVKAEPQDIQLRSTRPRFTLALQRGWVGSRRHPPSAGRQRQSGSSTGAHSLVCAPSNEAHFSTNQWGRTIIFLELVGLKYPQQSLLVSRNKLVCG